MPITVTAGTNVILILSSLSTGRVPILKFLSAKVKNKLWIMEKIAPVLIAILVSVDCLFNSTPCGSNHKYADGKAHAKNQDTDATKKWVAMNQKCCVILISAFQVNRQLTMIIIQTITARWSSGRAWKIHERLLKKFKRADKLGRQQRVAWLFCS